MFDAITRQKPAAGRFALPFLCAAALALAACEREQILPGERFSTDIPLSEAIPGEARAFGDPAAADAPRAISLPGVTQLGSWTQRGFNASNLTPHASLSGSLTPIWSANIGAGNSRRNRITADPVAADGRVFTLDATAGLVATSLTNGGTLWSTDLQPAFDRNGAVSGGGLAVSGGRLFATTGFGELVALDPASGGVLWRQRLDAGIGAPTVSGDTVYIVSRNNQAWALSTENGRINWQIPANRASALLSGGAAPAVGNGLVVFPFGSGELVGASIATGNQRWVTNVAGGRTGVAYANINDITGDPVLSGGRLYAGNQSGRVVALDPSQGQRLWTADDGAYSPVLVAGGNVFYVSDRNELIRLDAATGDRVWGTELPLYVNQRERRRRAVFTHYGPILASGRLLIASGDRQIRMFSPESGALVGSVALRNGAAAHPIVVQDTLLVVTENGQLHAFR
ncbi:PQQ-binding-like beta-propeller repeat protein [Gymnodinialimonas sp. 2305UL16-5]|uniref:PQQ-like beta-propeller repeat protein n=1 Tax=Gymnodinialimonas mytili TaxID=3126503 RepID=UPI0030B6417B